jgi:hypothetical protein
MKLELLKTALRQQRSNKDSDASCDASQVAKAFYLLIPEEIRPYFNPPRGVQLDDGTYLGSILQIGKGSLGRLHGPALELFTASILELIMEFDQRSDEERADNPLVISHGGTLVEWDVRRYSSSQDHKGRWQTIPDYSLYFDTTQSSMRARLSKQKEAKAAETSTSTGSSDMSNIEI